MERIGPYQIQAKIGQGGMGFVYRALDPVLDRSVALKVVVTGSSESEEFRARLLREARTASSLSHPAIVPIYQAGEDRNCVFIAMELVNGRSLARRADGPVPPDHAVAILGRIGSALDYAHTRGIIHRDVKPGNILIDETGSARLCDFGIARLVGGSDQITRTDFLVGTPFYMSPEQAEGKLGDGRSDQYSLAVVAYELLTGTRPFDAPSMAGVLARILLSMPKPAHTVNPALPPAASDVLTRALTRDPAQRYATCMDMVGALSTAVRPDADVAPHIKVPSTNHAGRRLRAIGSVAILLLLAGLALLFHFFPGSPRSVPPPSSATVVPSAATARQMTLTQPATASSIERPAVAASGVGEVTGRTELNPTPTKSRGSSVAAARYEADWPVFRGNLRRDGTTRFIGPASPQIAWVTKFDEQLSGPVVGSGGRAFVTAGRNLYAVEGGTIVWSALAGETTEPTPAIFGDGTVCVRLISGESRCFDQAGNKAPARQTLSWSAARSDNGVVYLTEGSAMRSGTWQFPAIATFSTSPALAADGDVCAGTASGQLICVNHLGQEDWTYQAPVRITGSPAASANGQVFFGCADRALYCVRRGELQWRFATAGAVYSAPVVGRDGVVYFGSNDGFLYAIDHAGELLWRQSLGSEIRSSPALDRAGRLYVTTINRRLYCLR